MVAARQETNDNITLVQPTGLPAKMVRIMAAVGNVAKAGRNDFQKYNFIQSDDVLDAVRAEMVKQNVVIFPRMVSYEQTAETKGFHAVVQFEFTLIDADSGETLSGTWFGEASDSGDKSFSKAGTSALKYWLLKTFLISAGEPDADTGSPEHEHDANSSRDPKKAFRGNGQQERRIPPQSNKNAPNSSAAQNNVSAQGDSSNGAANAVSWKETDVKELVAKYDGKLTVQDLLAVLNVKKFSEWTQGTLAAHQAAEAEWKRREMEF